MKNTKLYYLLQIGIIAISLVSFMTFTLPLISGEEAPPKSYLEYCKKYDSNSLANQLKHLDKGDAPDYAQVPVDKKILSDSELRGFRTPEVKVAESITFDDVHKYFNFASNVVGTVFPIIGFIMTVWLWISQRKQKKLEKVI
jgi:hypothetical protein